MLSRTSRPESMTGTLATRTPTPWRRRSALPSKERHCLAQRAARNSHPPRQFRFGRRRLSAGSELIISPILPANVEMVLSHGSLLFCRSFNDRKKVK